MDTTEIRYGQQAAHFLFNHQDAIANALRNHARRMQESANDARAQFEAGQADQAVKKAQDATMVTNNGYGNMAQMFQSEADQTTAIAEKLDALIEGRP